MNTSEITFEVTEAVEGGYDAKALGHSIFTQGEDWEDLKAMVKDAVRCHFDEDTLPPVVRLHLVRDEVIAVSGSLGTCRGRILQSRSGGTLVTVSLDKEAATLLWPSRCLTQNITLLFRVTGRFVLEF